MYGGVDYGGAPYASLLLEEAVAVAGRQEKGKVGMVYTLVRYDAPQGSQSASGRLELTNIDRGKILFSEANASSYQPGESQMFMISETADTGSLGGERIEVNFDVTSIAEDGVFRFSYGNTLESDHEHDVSPGMNETFLNQDGDSTSFYPSNSDVIVNGSGLGVSLGDGAGEFEESVDISGELNPGQVNDIQVTSDTLGNMEVFVEGDVYRQIFGGG